MPGQRMTWSTADPRLGAGESSPGFRDIEAAAVGAVEGETLSPRSGPKGEYRAGKHNEEGRHLDAAPRHPAHIVEVSPAAAPPVHDAGGHRDAERGAGAGPEGSLRGHGLSVMWGLVLSGEGDDPPELLRICRGRRLAGRRLCACRKRGAGL